MTDLEISKQLALAIGWTEDKMIRDGNKLRCYRGERQWGWQYFDYRDWAIIGPIAARYKMLVDFKIDCAWRNNENIGTRADTPQKAVAMAVIEGVKK